MALGTFMSNESVCRCHFPWGKDVRSVPYFFPQRDLAKQQQNDPPTDEKSKPPPRQTLLRENTLSKSVACQIGHGCRALSNFRGVLASDIDGKRAIRRWDLHAQIIVADVDDIAIGKRT